MLRFGGMPGQRETIRRGIKTEVLIPVFLCGIAMIAGVGVAYVFQARTKIIYQNVVNATGFNFLVKIYTAQGWFVFSLALLLPLKALFAASLANIYDQNYPPTHAPTGDQLVAPWLIRQLTGATGAAPAEAMETAPPDAIAPPPPLDVTFRIKQKTAGGEKTTLHAPKLTMMQWGAVARCCDRGKNLSVRNLHKPGGLPWSPARKVNKELREHRIIPLGRGAAVAPGWFIEWVSARNYRRNRPFPTPKGV